MNVSIEERLGLLSFEIDKEKHIEVNINICKNCKNKSCLIFCPAGRYTISKDSIIQHDSEGCLECGTCKLACPNGAIEFNYPRGGFGVQYKYG